MTFKVRRLRIAVPWDEAEEVSAGEAGDARGLTFAAEPQAIYNAQCLDWASFAVSSCADDFTTYIVVQGILFDQFDAAALESTRQQLQSRLDQVTAAQQGLAENGGQAT